jgi:hypothetical protein
MSRLDWKVEEAREFLSFLETIDTFSDTPTAEVTRVAGFYGGITGATVYLSYDMTHPTELAQGFAQGVDAKRRSRAARGEEPDQHDDDD